MKTAVTELLGIEYPIIQGGMAWVGEYQRTGGYCEAAGSGGEKAYVQAHRGERYASESQC